MQNRLVPGPLYRVPSWSDAQNKYLRSRNLSTSSYGMILFGLTVVYFWLWLARDEGMGTKPLHEFCLASFWPALVA